ncbi:MAG: Flp pilus assembly complex ATPase component TadA, partial [Phycisphaerae bacterium]|nr:Flp pilus assembly complex ATPase component TadA [Phycisphaerae bacterium]
LWSGLVLLAGAVGFIIWLMVPLFLVGLAVFVVTVAIICLLYIVHRNTLVDPAHKIGSKQWRQDVKDRRHHKHVQIDTKLRMYDKDSQPVMLTDAEAGNRELVQSYNLTQALLYDIVLHRASEVDIKPEGPDARVLYMIDGVASKRHAILTTELDVIVEFLQGKACTCPEEPMYPLKGRISVDMAETPIDMEIIISHATHGKRLAIRVIQELVQTNLDLLGMDEPLVAKLQDMLAGPGLLIVAGGPGYGTTSTMYSLLRKQDAFTHSIVAIEAKTLDDLPNITQHEYGEISNLPGTLAPVIRHDPDILALDACRNAQVAQAICKYASQKTVILIVKAWDSLAALATWIKIVGAVGPAVKPLRGVLCQQLLRTLCTTCREPYKPDADLCNKLGLPAEKVEAFYRSPTTPITDAKGNIIPCSLCQNTGYIGRTGAFELLEINDAIRQKLAANASLAEIKAAARQSNMRSMQHHALAKIVAGDTSIQEIIRVQQHQQAMAKRSAQ